MSKEEKIRRIIIIVGTIMLIAGMFMALTRRNVLDEAIGYVFVSNNKEYIDIDGYKYSYNNGDERNKIDNFITIEKAKDIPIVNYDPNGENNNISVSYTEEYSSLSYKVYDEEFKCIIDSQPSLTMPGETGKKYYIELSVDWGKENKGVTVVYYFAIDIS